MHGPMNVKEVVVFSVSQPMALDGRLGGM